MTGGKSSKATRATARAAAIAKSEGEKQAEINQAQGHASALLAIAEAYPELKSNANFSQLQDQLEGTENRIAVERMRYNEAVQAYNTSRRQFPANVTNKIFSFKDYPFFEATEAAKEVPKVNFGSAK